MAAATNSTPQISSKSPTIRRILREAAEISSSPSADYVAEPLESDLFEWHFTLRGPPNSAFSQGIYHGRIILPSTYPLRPPSFRFTTPNGRFEANREICLSISGHHEETWQPAWGIRTAIVAYVTRVPRADAEDFADDISLPCSLRSFMETSARGQLGGLESPDSVRRRFAQESTAFRCSTCGRTNADIIAESEKRAQESSSAAADVEVPHDLRMGFKDEMEAKKAASAVKNDHSDAAAELAEGFVATTPISPRRDSLQYAAPPPQSAVVTNQVTHLSRRQSVAPATPLVQRQPHPTLPNQPNGVPLWIDRAIVVLGTLLTVLLLKILLGI
ncbi:putative ubiquitin-conjugating enzyme protein [Drechmeria coniospora]|uniref:Putative ubiquitin-conjugating enzyme protein n=1 Tax=Drechmeria coniospora TaxID=98403 RepID=A0A151GNF2_DRECN|nr:putative ubiquitin-conjugating enzyme protein [Drechmeria coniospora]KYK58522.1 putative ubiquitin-conjugating enzyme protein [Drechmeria coniospora]